ncbi:MAG: ribonuclease R [Bacillota bacterium]
MVKREEIMAFMREALYRPMTEAELVRALGVAGRDLRRFRRLLREMEAEGLVYQTRAARYGLPERMNLVVGRLQGHPKGYAFLIPDNRALEDVFVGAGHLNGAMHNDRVVVRVMPGRNGRREGEVVKILRRANHRVVGTFQRKRNYGFVVCDDVRLPQDVFVPRGSFGGARTGDKVVAEITVWPAPRRAPQGRVVRVLGPAGAPHMDTISVCHRYGLDPNFPREVLREAERIPAEVTPADLAGRRDLRGWTIVTIDGEDARDLDDAVSLERLSGGRWRLGVHIADVGYYVPEGSALDREAYRRGTSVYLPDFVVPMLPPRLSNGICSLNPREDRLTLSVVMDIDGSGEVVGYEMFPSVIRTVERMTYTAVRRILVDDDPAEKARYAPLVETFRAMQELCLVLRRRRLARGAIDFNIPEAKVVVDGEGRPLEIRRVERTIAEQIIEEFMLITNETVATHFHHLGVPFIYRVHETPDEEKIAALEDLLRSLGYTIKGFPRLHPGALQEVLDQVAGRPEERLVNTVMLRSMKQARYAPVMLEHFGLASPNYTHFTSPIRRYPDLFIHRIVREVLTAGRLDPRHAAALENILPSVAQQASERERVAMDAEREAVDAKKIAFMEDKVGQVYPGIISGVTAFGMFVELENLVEGLVTLTNLTDDYYLYDEKAYRLVGQRTGRIYRLGDPITVRVLKVSSAERQIEFAPA